MIRKTIETTVVIMICANISSVNAGTLSDALNKCKLVENSLKRLVCFENIANNLNRYEDEVYSSIPPKVHVQKTQKFEDKESALATESSSAAKFGLAEKNVADSVMVEGNLIATVDAVFILPSKKLKITLSNGQVWQQTSNEKRRRPKEGDKIEIWRGALNAFYMKKQGKKASIRVKRIS